MANKRTGRPAGRPKTKEYVSLQARVPTVLADLVKRYAAQHGKIPLSVLIRDGLEWRIGDGDPRGTGLYLDEPAGIREEYNSNTGIGPGVPGEEVLQEVRTLLAQQWAQIQTLAQELERQRVPASDGVYSSNTIIESAKRRRRAERVPGEETTRAWRERAFIFDPARHQWGELCHKQHDRDGGRSVREQDNNECVDCRWERSTAYKERKRQAKREAQPVTG